MNKQIELSVIIPVYNGEKYIEKNLKKILKYVTNSEIIIINDGSTDKTLQIIEKISNKYKNVRIINKKNGGVSSARNVGLSEAKGEYILFVDADDRTLKNIKIAQKIAREENYDLIKCNYRIQRRIKFIYKSIHCIKNIKSGEIDIKTVYNSIISGYGFNCTWGQLIKRDIIQNLRFDKKYIMAEDLDFNMKLYSKVHRIYYLDKPIVSYMYNNKSATRTNNFKKAKKQILDILEVYSKMYKYISEWNLNIENIKIIDKHIKDTVNNLLNENQEYKEDLIKCYKEYEKNGKDV